MEPDGSEPVDVSNPPVGRARRNLLAPLDSVRVRITVAATLAFGFAFAGASVALVHTVRGSLEARAHADSSRAMHRLAHQLEAGTNPDQLDTGSSELVTYQIYTQDNQVIAGSTSLPVLRAQVTSYQDPDGTH